MGAAWGAAHVSSDDERVCCQLAKFASGSVSNRDFVGVASIVLANLPHLLSVDSTTWKTHLGYSSCVWRPGQSLLLQSTTYMRIQCLRREEMGIESGSITEEMTNVVQGIVGSAPFKTEGITVHLTYKGVVKVKILWIQRSGRGEFTNNVSRTKRDLDS